MDQDEIIAALLIGPKLASDRRTNREMVAQWAGLLEVVRDWRAQQAVKSQAEAPAAAAPEPAPDAPSA